MALLPEGLGPRERRVMLGILVAGFCLTLIAGFVNGSVLSLVGVPVSHMSGAATHLSFNLSGQHEATLMLIVSVIVAFFAGAVFCGALIGSSGFYLGGRYGVALLIEAGLLALAGVCAWQGRLEVAAPIAAMACGLQNAMAASFRGLVVRTTHVTGIVTDLGVLIGQGLRRHPVSIYQITLLSLLLTGFVTGGVVGVASLRWLGPLALELPAIPCAVFGASYTAWRVHARLRNGGSPSKHDLI